MDEKIRELSAEELQAVSGGCPCTNNTFRCGCDKPSPGHK